MQQDKKRSWAYKVIWQIDCDGAITANDVVITGGSRSEEGRGECDNCEYAQLHEFIFACVCGLGLGTTMVVIVTLVAGYWAVGICGEAELRLGKVDPGEVILDEYVAMPLCFLGWSELTLTWPAWAVLLAGFALFRFFDILKPLGIARLQNLPSGWGVVLDDLAAALVACGGLHVGHALWMAH